MSNTSFLYGVVVNRTRFTLHEILFALRVKNTTLLRLHWGYNFV